jgi:hypothetical protein
MLLHYWIALDNYCMVTKAPVDWFLVHALLLLQPLPSLAACCCSILLRLLLLLLLLLMAAAPIIKSLECSSAASCRRLLCRSAATLGVLVDEQQSQCIARRKLPGNSWNPRVDTTACGKNCCLRGAVSFARGGGRAVVRARTRTRRRSGCLQQLGVRAELQELAQNEVRMTMPL